jgi:hypothetical protein
MRFHRCEFSWLQLGNFLRCKISAHHLERNRDAGYEQRNANRGIAIPMTAKMMWNANDIPIWERAKNKSFKMPPVLQ